MRGAAGTGSTRARCGAMARPPSSPRRYVRCAAITVATASACWWPECPRAAHLPRSWDLRYPKLVKAVAVHSGLACGAAKSPLTAIAVMQGGPEQDVEAIGSAARAAAPGRALPVPLLAIHGEADSVVAPRNALALVRQFLQLNGRAPAVGDAATASGLPDADSETRNLLPNGRTEIVREWRHEGRLIARLVEVTGLGHAWSGGDPALAYHDAAAPDATALIGAFFADALS